MNTKTVNDLVEKIDIFIVTYNRSSFLKSTLSSLSSSPFSTCNITILDNCSEDKTKQICENNRQLFKNFNIISHRVNIGVVANYLRAVELSKSPYTWVLSDDDDIDLSNCDDVIQALINESVDLISLGTGAQSKWKRGYQTTAKELISEGYRFFFAFTFFTGLIFKTNLFNSSCFYSGYKSARSRYPNIDYLYKAYQNDYKILISKKHHIIARIPSEEEQPHVGGLYWFSNWVDACQIIEDKRIRELAIFQCTKDSGYLSFFIVILKGLVNEKVRRGGSLRKIINILSKVSFPQSICIMVASSFLIIPRALLSAALKIRHGSILQSKIDKFRF